MPEVTLDAALTCIFDRRNKRRKIWTPTILINRMGISRPPTHYSNYDRQAKQHAKRVLHELWLQHKLLRKIEPDTRNRYLGGSEVAYVRPEDAPSKFLVPCRTCGEPCPSFGDRDLLCETCNEG